MRGKKKEHLNKNTFQLAQEKASKTFRMLGHFHGLPRWDCLLCLRKLKAEKMQERAWYCIAISAS